MRLVKYKFFIIIILSLCMASAFPARSAEIDPYIYNVIAKGVEEIAVRVFIKESLYSSADVIAREIEEERNQLAGELRYDCEHNMTKKFLGTYYAREISSEYGNNLHIIKVCLFENYKGDPHNLNHPYYPPDGSSYPGDFGATRYVVYEFISIEDAVDLELSENDLPGDHQTYINYLMRRYPLFPGENVLDENSPETYIQIGGTGDALSKIDLVADSAISTSYTRYEKTDLAKQRIPIPFTQNQIISLLGYRQKELSDLIENYKLVSAQLQKAAGLSLTLPIFNKIWPQIEALGGRLKNEPLRPQNDPEGILPEEYPAGLDVGQFSCIIPASSVDEVASIPEIQEIIGCIPAQFFSVAESSNNNSSSISSSQNNFYYPMRFPNQTVPNFSGFPTSSTVQSWPGVNYYSLPIGSTFGFYSPTTWLPNFGSFIPISNRWSNYGKQLGYNQPFSNGIWNFGFADYKLDDWANPGLVPITETSLWESSLNPDVQRTIQGFFGKVYSWPQGDLLYGPPYM